MSKKNHHTTPAHPVTLRPSTVYESQLLAYLFISAAVAQGCGLFVCFYFAVLGQCWRRVLIVERSDKTRSIFLFFTFVCSPILFYLFNLFAGVWQGIIKRSGLILCLFWSWPLECNMLTQICMLHCSSCTAADAVYSSSGDEWMESEDVCRAAESGGSSRNQSGWEGVLGSRRTTNPGETNI